MMFCGQTCFSSGVRQSSVLRLREVSLALLKASYENVSAFVIAFRETKLGYEWRIFYVPLSMRLCMKRARYEHAMSRRSFKERFRFFVVPVEQDHLNRIVLGKMVPYLEFLAESKSASKKFVTRAQAA